ncbi:MAG: SDR family oxidoreductase [Planctomycetota bacterium]|nr:SDR family oxidoreductase [Planctomycetota bacterium]
MSETEIPAESVALIPGGSGGVGQAVARALQGVGLRPVLVGRSRERLEAAVEAVGGDVHFEVADVTNRDAMDRALAIVSDAVGPPLVLVNAAGIAESSPLLPPDDALWDKTMAINAKGAWIAATACLPAMRKAGRGFIAQIASTAALEGYRYTAAYVASKHAMLGLSRALATEVGEKGVRVVTVCPGFLDTPMTDRTVANMTAKTGMSEADARSALAAMNASGRLIRPDEVAAAIVELLKQPDSHGAELRLD